MVRRAIARGLVLLAIALPEGAPALEGLGAHAAIPGAHAAAIPGMRGVLPVGTLARRVAVLPVHDLSGGRAPLADVHRLVGDHLVRECAALVPDEAVAAFLASRRIRYTGALSRTDAAALRVATGADFVVSISADRYETAFPPRVALGALAVDTAQGNVVATAYVALAGNDAPGLLGLGEVTDPWVLLERAAARVVADLAARADARAGWEHPSPPRALRPAVSSASDTPMPEGPLRVAVLPLENETSCVPCGEVVTGHVFRAMAGRPAIALVDPGTVRDAMLQYRIVQDWGVSLPQADLMREELPADLLLTGRLLVHEDGGSGPSAVPEIAFSVRAVDARTRRAVWSAYSAHRGDDGVVAFDAGRRRCPEDLGEDMAEAVAEALVNALERAREESP